MDMRQNKRGFGKFNFDMIGNVILVIIGVVILFSILASVFPTVVSAGASLNSTGFPLATLFAKSSAAGWYLLAAAVILVLVKVLLPSGKK